MTLGRLSLVLAAALGVAATGCASRRAQPPFPADYDPDAGYCLVWVPGSTRQVPRLKKVRDGEVVERAVCRKDFQAEEVVVRGQRETHCRPPVVHRYQVVQVTPDRVEWEKTRCGCEKNCWRPVGVPGDVQVCEKTVTQDGVSYCAETPPRYDVVVHERTQQVKMREYEPAEYEVVWDKQPFLEGRWEWQRRYDCKCTSSPPARPNLQTPAPECRRADPTRRANFNYAPPAD